jgi:hypothetical protein
MNNESTEMDNESTEMDIESTEMEGVEHTTTRPTPATTPTIIVDDEA